MSIKQKGCHNEASKTCQYGLRTARHGGLHVTGSYKTAGRSSRAFKGVYNVAMGTTVLVASTREDGQTFHERRTPEAHLPDQLIDSPER